MKPFFNYYEVHISSYLITSHISLFFYDPEIGNLSLIQGFGFGLGQQLVSDVI